MVSFFQAIAEYVTCAGAEVTESDVIIGSGCSGCLDLCISVLANPGDNILVPRPGFPLYATLANGMGIQTRQYNLLPERDWEADLGQMERLIDSVTRAIVVNNPSNPCGSVFSREHMLAILDVAERNRVPVIADEIYEHFVFPGIEYLPLASLTKEVPILSCSGLTKRFLVPGWRLGWITVHDRNGVFAREVRKGLQCLSQRIMGSNMLVQGAVPSILSNVPRKFFGATIDLVKASADLAFSRLSTVPGLQPVMPSGAMYIMVGVDTGRFPAFSSDLEIVEALFKEQSLFVLPGKCFGVTDFVRLVLTVSTADMAEACDRLEAFSRRHFVKAEEDSSRPESSSGGSSNMISEEEDDEVTTTASSKSASTSSLNSWQ